MSVLIIWRNNFLTNFDLGSSSEGVDVMKIGNRNLKEKKLCRNRRAKVNDQQTLDNQYCVEKKEVEIFSLDQICGLDTRST